MNNLTVINQNGTFFVDSREVAEMVEKQHAHLMRDIKGYLDILDPNPKLDSAQFFVLHSYTDAQNQTRPCYLITRKGCDMVANKMTGEKGVLFTAAYVTKFEEMEKALASKALIIPSNYAEALRELAATWEENQRLLPKAEYFDALVERNLLTNFRDTAKELKVKETDFISWLLKTGYIYRDASKKLKPYAQHVPKLFEIKEQQRGEWAGTQTLITPHGRETFRLLMKD